jgi:hypothetical protein
LLTVTRASFLDALIGTGLQPVSHIPEELVKSRKADFGLESVWFSSRRMLRCANNPVAGRNATGTSDHRGSHHSGNESAAAGCAEV